MNKCHLSPEPIPGHSSRFELPGGGDFRDLVPSRLPPSPRITAPFERKTKAQARAGQGRTRFIPALGHRRQGPREAAGGRRRRGNRSGPRAATPGTRPPEPRAEETTGRGQGARRGEESTLHLEARGGPGRPGRALTGPLRGGRACRGTLASQAATVGSPGVPSGPPDARGSVPPSGRRARPRAGSGLTGGGKGRRSGRGRPRAPLTSAAAGRRHLPHCSRRSASCGRRLPARQLGRGRA